MLSRGGTKGLLYDAYITKRAHERARRNANFDAGKWGGLGNVEAQTHGARLRAGRDGRGDRDGGAIEPLHFSDSSHGRLRADVAHEAAGAVTEPAHGREGSRGRVRTCRN